MESTKAYHPAKTNSKATLWAGRIISTLCILFLLFDAIMKMIKESHYVQGTVQLGWPEHSTMTLGIILLVCTVLYIIPRTAILGAILLTGYLGGATATMLRIDQSILFSFIFGILVWVGLYLRDEKLRELIPFRREEKN